MAEDFISKYPNGEAVDKQLDLATHENRDVIDKLDAEDGRLTFDGVPVSSNAINPNILINGNFQIRQDGNSILINPNTWTYTADMVLCKGTGNVTVETNKITFSDATNVIYIVDDKEYNFYEGKTVTLSYSKNGIIHVSTYKINSIVFVNLNFNAGDILNWWKLELGDISTPFIPRSYPLELIDCQCDYEKSYDADIPPGSSVVPGTFESFYTKDIPSQNLFFQTPYKVTKRIKPTISIYAGSTGTPNKIFGLTDPGGGAYELLSYGISGANSSTLLAVYAHGDPKYYRYGFHWVSDARKRY